MARLIITKQTVPRWFFHFGNRHGLFSGILEFSSFNLQLQSSFLFCDLVFDGFLNLIQLEFILSHNLFNFVSCERGGLSDIVVVHFLVFMFDLHDFDFLFLIYLDSISSLCFFGGFWDRVLGVAHGFDYFGWSHNGVHLSFEVHVFVTSYGFEILHPLGIKLENLHHYLLRNYFV